MRLCFHTPKLTETVRHSASWWRRAHRRDRRMAIKGYTLHQTSCWTSASTIINTTKSACLGCMWPLGQSRLLATHLQTTVACASPRPVPLLTLSPYLPSRHADRFVVIFPPPRQRINSTLKQLFRNYEACLGWEIASRVVRR